jgi:hypothetical protein
MACGMEPPISVYVKSGSYAGFTCSNDNVYIYCEPNTTITSAITLSGDNVCLELGSGCDVQGTITLSGTQCSLLRRNGVDTDGVVVTGTECFVDGGGLGTIDDGGTATHGVHFDDTSPSTDGIIINTAAQTTTGATGDDAMEIDGIRVVVSGCKVISSEENGLVSQANNDVLMIGCMVLDADQSSIGTSRPRTRQIGNHSISAGNDGFIVASGADDSVIVGNIAQDPGQSGIDADGANQVVVGNRADPDGSGGGVDDGSGGTNTVASNDETSF